MGVCENLNVGLMTTDGEEKVIRPEEFQQPLTFGGKTKENIYDTCDEILAQLDSELTEAFVKGKRARENFATNTFTRRAPKRTLNSRTENGSTKTTNFNTTSYDYPLCFLV